MAGKKVSSRSTSSRLTYRNFATYILVVEIPYQHQLVSLRMLAAQLTTRSRSTRRKGSNRGVVGDYPSITTSGNRYLSHAVTRLFILRKLWGSGRPYRKSG